MAKFIPLLFMVLWSASSFANLPSDDTQVISQWTAHLNMYYSDLSLAPDVSKSEEAPQVLKQLKDLEDYLHGDRNLGDGSLTLLACDRCVCVGCAGAQ